MQMLNDGSIATGTATGYRKLRKSACRIIDPQTWSKIFSTSKWMYKLDSYITRLTQKRCGTSQMSEN